MDTHENNCKSLPNRARDIIKRIIEQAMPEKASPGINNDYTWVAAEVQKEHSNNVRRELLSNLFKRLNSWYEKQLQKRFSSYLSIFYLHVVYFLYCLQLDKSVISYPDNRSLLKVEMSYEIIESFKASMLPIEAKEILSYLIYRKDLRINITWEEYRHITNREMNKAEEKIENFFKISETNIQGVKEYTKSKQAYLVMQSLLK